MKRDSYNLIVTGICVIMFVSLVSALSTSNFGNIDAQGNLTVRGNQTILLSNLTINKTFIFNRDLSRFGIGTENPLTTFHVVGASNLSGSVNISESLNVRENITINGADSFNFIGDKNAIGGNSFGVGIANPWSNISGVDLSAYAGIGTFYNFKTDSLLSIIAIQSNQPNWIMVDLDGPIDARMFTLINDGGTASFARTDSGLSNLALLNFNLVGNYTEMFQNRWSDGQTSFYGGNLSVGTEGANPDFFVDGSSGFVGFGTSSPTTQVEYRGTINYSGTGSTTTLFDNGNIAIGGSPSGQYGIELLGNKDANFGGGVLYVQNSSTIALGNHMRWLTNPPAPRVSMILNDLDESLNITNGNLSIASGLVVNKTLFKIDPTKNAISINTTTTTNNQIKANLPINMSSGNLTQNSPILGIPVFIRVGAGKSCTQQCSNLSNKNVFGNTNFTCVFVLDGVTNGTVACDVTQNVRDCGCIIS